MVCKFATLLLALLVLVLLVGCDEHKQTPISEETKAKRERLMPDGKMPDPRTARQRMQDE